MKKIAFLLLAIALLGSCNKDGGPVKSEKVTNADLQKYSVLTANAVNDLLKDQKLAANGTDKEAISGTQSKSQTKVIKIKGSGLIEYIPNACGSGTLQFQSTGTATSTILGTMSQKTIFCIDLSTGKATGNITGTGTTPNGDELYYTLVGMGEDASTKLTFQNYVFTGGTGKYAAASGSMALVYDVFEPSNFSYTGTGTITF